MSFFYVHHHSRWNASEIERRWQEMERRRPPRCLFNNVIIEPADIVITRLFIELQRSRSPQQDRIISMRLVERLLRLPVPKEEG